MTQFLQFHLLTSYPPSNPNRDDQGQPKQAVVGGVPRLRLSSQSIKRALRKSSYFENDLAGKLGTRTKRLYEHLLEESPVGVTEVETAAKAVAEIFGELEKNKEKGVWVAKTLAFISPAELKRAKKLMADYIAGEAPPQDKELKKRVRRKIDRVLNETNDAVDIAMFGRMLAGTPDFSREAAVQVGHAITTHKAQAQDDWFSAVDELTRPEDTGAGHLDDNPFGSGVYYLYACVNVNLLVENLTANPKLAAKKLAAKGAESLARALAKATPGGKRNSFAHHPRAIYIRAEAGAQQPRDLTGAFFDPVPEKDAQNVSIELLEEMADKLDRAYGPGCDEHVTMNVLAGNGTLDDIARFAHKVVRNG